MMSKAASQVIGISKKASLTIVRIPRPVANPQERLQAIVTGKPITYYRFAAFMSALTMIWGDLNPLGKIGQPQRSVVINISIGFPYKDSDLPNYPPIPSDDFYPLYALLKRLTDQGVIIVLSTGNGGAATMSDVCLISLFHV
jgi:hypothetical protein